MKIIALSGLAKSGKSTVMKIIKLADSWNNSKYFKSIYPDKQHFIKHFIEFHSEAAISCTSYEEVSFANSLKCCISYIFGIDRNLLDDQLVKESPNTLGITDKDGHVYTFRELLQLLGTEVGRNISNDLWVKSAFNSLEENGNYIISDVRYINEAEACLKAGAILIRIDRNVEQMDHSSETELKDFKSFNHIITNNGSLEELINKILQLNII